MKKKIAVLLFMLVLVAGMLPLSASAEGLGNFQKVNTYSNQFVDVSTSQWYAPSVKESFEYGLMTGTDTNKFAPGSYVTIAQTITIAARLHSIYHTAQDSFTPTGGKWYEVYVSYAESNGIVKSGSYANYNAYATRAQFAKILSKAFPSTAYPAINTVEAGAIPDVAMSSNYAARVYTLYRAGILTGNDEKGTFSPNSCIKRSEVATITTRMADTSLRRSFTLVSPSPEETTSQKNALKRAKEYLNVLPFSYQGLIKQLEYEKFSHTDAVYAADRCGANWNEQAAKQAKLYLKIMTFSRDGLIDQLEFDGFTYEQAVYGVNANGL